LPSEDQEAIHPDLAPRATTAVTHKDSTALCVKVGRRKVERLADP
jgi:hypothetical protein